MESTSGTEQCRGFVEERQWRVPVERSNVGGLWRGTTGKRQREEVESRQWGEKWKDARGGRS